METRLQNFIWDNKRPNIRHSTSIGDYLEGSHVKRYHKHITDKNLNNESLMGNKALPVFVCCFFCFFFVFFYKEFVYLLQDRSCKETLDAQEIANEVLRNNDYITREEKSLYDKICIQYNYYSGLFSDKGEP